VDFLACHDPTHGYRTIGDLLGDVHDVRRDAEELCTRGFSQTAKRGDHFVENQQDTVLVADLAQALQIPLGRHNDARRAGHRFDDDGGNVGCVVQLDQLEQFVGQLNTAVLRLAA